MSPSDAIRLTSSAKASEVKKPDSTIKELEQLAERVDLTDDEIRAIVSATTRLYANASSRAGRELPPLTPAVSTTDALTLSCALLRSQDLTPFEMAMWFGRGGKQD
jgi:hypothetical protein